MSRLSIDITPEQHERLQALAALRGQSITEYVLEQTLPSKPDETSLTEIEAIQQLDALLKPRIEAAERGELSNKTFAQIKQEAITSAES
jgi:uncharacterized protein (DUF1778 family)